MDEMEQTAQEVVNAWWRSHPMEHKDDLVVRVAAALRAARAQGRAEAAEVADKYRNRYGGEHAAYHEGQDSTAAAIAEAIRALT